MVEGTQKLLQNARHASARGMLTSHEYSSSIQVGMMNAATPAHARRCEKEKCKTVCLTACAERERRGGGGEEMRTFV